MVSGLGEGLVGELDGGVGLVSGLVCDGLNNGLVSGVNNGLNNRLDSGPIGWFGQQCIEVFAGE